MKLSDIDRTYILGINAVMDFRVPQPDWLPNREWRLNDLDSDPVWGCRLAHHDVIQDAVNKGYETILIVEDDCLWESQRVVEHFLANVVSPRQIGSQWDLLWLGGLPTDNTQHWVYNNNWIAVTELDRTHSIVVREHVFGDLLTAFANPDLKRTPDVYHHALNAPPRPFGLTLAPRLFLTGQAAGWSHVNKRERPERW